MIKKILAPSLAAFGLILVTPEASRALVVTVSGVSYELTTQTDSFKNLQPLLEVQPFWGNANLAGDLAFNAWNSGANRNDPFFTTSTNPNNSPTNAPYFAYATFGSGGQQTVNYADIAEFVPGLNANSNRTWAVVQGVVPIPAPLPLSALFGFAPALAYIRRYRLRRNALELASCQSSAQFAEGKGR